jgi:hypothetical protein
MNISTVGDVARRFGQPQWRIREIVDADDFPKVERFGLKRVLTSRHVELIRRRLVDRGLLDHNGNADEPVGAVEAVANA